MISPHLISATSRNRDLSLLRRYFTSKQYEGKPDFYTGKKGKGSQPVPIRERKPCVVYPLPRIAVRQLVNYMFGGDRFPTLTVKESKGNEFMPAISAVEAERLTSGIGSLCEKSNLQSVLDSLAEDGLSVGTACAIISVIDGVISFDAADAENCEVELDRAGRVKKLVWCYQYEREEEEKGALVCKRYWFRRDYDETNTTVYDAVPVELGKDPEWSPTSTPHGFSFCPVVWIRNCPKSADATDGVSVYSESLNEFDALNLAYSQRHRGVNYFGTPQVWETGVEPGDGPSQDAMRGSGYSGPDDRKESPYGTTEKARKYSPDNVWSYESHEVQLGMLETSGSSFDVASKHVDDIRSRLLEDMNVVLPSKEEAAGGVMTASLMKLRYAPMLSAVASMRKKTWWPHGLKAVLSMCMRVVMELGGEGLLMEDATELAALLKSFSVEVEGGPIWVCPDIEVKWGEDFPPTQEEITSATTAASGAMGAGLIGANTATRHVAKHYGISDINKERKEADVLLPIKGEK